MTTYLQDTVRLDQVPLIATTCVGHVGHITADRQVWVDFPTNENGLVPARMATSDSAAIAIGIAVLLVFEGQDPSKPIIVGVVRDRLEAAPNVNAADKPEAVIDGRRIVLEGHEEIVLRCGKACITLRRDGKITIKGVELLSKATGTNRMRGGSVAIN